MIEILSILTTILAVWGVVLNNRKYASCFIFWLVSNSISCAIHLATGLWGLALRDAIFWLLAWEGLRRWKKN